MPIIHLERKWTNRGEEAIHTIIFSHQMEGKTFIVCNEGSPFPPQPFPNNNKKNQAHRHTKTRQRSYPEIEEKGGNWDQETSQL